jgi:hypothetical protein
MLCIVASGSGNDRNSFCRFFHDKAYGIEMLFVRHGRRFPGGSAYNQCIDAVFNLKIDDFSKRLKINSVIFEWRN